MRTKVQFGVVQFPGSNCDNDALYATSHAVDAESRFLWHKETQIPSDIDCVILPGGFSYGDYLRSGAIARFSPIMKEVIAFANRGGYVVGICNGFQVLTEAGLLPGALARNINQLFNCKTVYLKTVNNQTAFSSSYELGSILGVPIAHGEGNYFADANTIKELEDNNQVVFCYSETNGLLTDSSNPNGSINNIAGIINKSGNVFGMMPHPERVCDPLLGSTDGVGVFQSLVHALQSVHA
ncbi:MAG: phosphoribosylformylglycinamidine synthase subunit PurQ [Candidatus Kapaibacterium sp.]